VEEEIFWVGMGSEQGPIRNLQKFGQNPYEPHVTEEAKTTTRWSESWPEKGDARKVRDLPHTTVCTHSISNASKLNFF
jgi:hypothetical protein